MSFEEIPSPKFWTGQCHAACCACGENAVLYWVKDEVWNGIRSSAQCCGGHVCVKCAKGVLGRDLTLHDLAIEKYLFTAKNYGDGQLPVPKHCLVDVMLGAAQLGGVDFPSEWCSMWTEYVDLGKTLASQTANPEQIVPQMIEQTLKCFPNFENPYENLWADELEGEGQ
jgi:hypothetical protein